MKKKIAFYYQDLPQKHLFEYIANNHTSVHRIAEILQYFRLDDYAQQILNSYEESVNE